ncbi:telomere binding protein [Microbotryomycetes sp. JL201]|nr:telomere binding protein [Microbotryomycetes sp. JL201]
MSVGVTTSAQALDEPIKSLEVLLDVLLTPLAALGLLDDRPELARQYTTRASDAFSAQRFLKRQVALVQQALVKRTWPEWAAALSADELELLKRWFCPPKGLNDATRAQSQPQPLGRQTIELASTLLVKLAQEFAFDEAYPAIVLPPRAKGKQVDLADDTLLSDRWHEFVKTVLSMPAHVANAWGALDKDGGLGSASSIRDMPAELQLGTFLTRMTKSMVLLAGNMSADGSVVASAPTDLSAVLGGLLTTPEFASTFIDATVPTLMPSATFPTPVDELMMRQRHAKLWQDAIVELPDRQVRRLLRDVLGQFQHKMLATVSDHSREAKCKACAVVLERLFGPLRDELLSSFELVVLDEGSAWDGEQGTIASVAALYTAASGPESASRYFTAISEAWTSLDVIKHGGRPRRVSLLLLSIARQPLRNKAVSDLATSPSFLNAVSAHLSLVDPTTRLLGMLVAEIVSERALEPDGELKPLNFGDDVWNGDGEPHRIARALRKLFADQLHPLDDAEWKGWLRTAFVENSPAFTSPARKVSVRQLSPSPTPVATVPLPQKTKSLISIIGENDPDDLPAYPLPAAPSASQLSILESDDPSLYASALPGTNASTTRKRGRLRPPVYIPELTAYLKGQDPEGGKEEADGEAERIELGLSEGESLIRRKADWGGEVAENAVDLTFTVMGMQDQFEVERFEDKRLGLLTSLVWAAPTQTVPAIIEQYFHNNYSITQRNTMLSALALGARELAGLPMPLSITNALTGEAESAFPSKQLPDAMHRKLLGANGIDVIDRLSTDLTNVALSNARSEAETTLPEAAREKVIRVRRFGTAKSPEHKRTHGRITYLAVATEYFIMPLVNRFWLYVKDATATSSAGNPYTTGRINSVPTLLEPIVLSKFFSTVAVLVHASRHAPTFTTVTVPTVLSLLIMLKPSRVDEADDVVQTSQMELLLTVFEAVSELDHGDSLVNSVHGDGQVGIDLVMQIKEWAEQVFELDERRNVGSNALGRSGRASAGLLLRVDEVLQRWRGRMGWT